MALKPKTHVHFQYCTLFMILEQKTTWGEKTEENSAAIDKNY